jgi:hypothetical protein
MLSENHWVEAFAPQIGGTVQNASTRRAQVRVNMRCPAALTMPHAES